MVKSCLKIMFCYKKTVVFSNRTHKRDLDLKIKRCIGLPEQLAVVGSTFNSSNYFAHSLAVFADGSKC